MQTMQVTVGVAYVQYCIEIDFRSLLSKKTLCFNH